MTTTLHTDQTADLVIRSGDITLYLDDAHEVDPAMLTIDRPLGQPVMLTITPDLRDALRAVVRMWDQEDEAEAHDALVAYDRADAESRWP